MTIIRSVNRRIDQLWINENRNEPTTVGYCLWADEAMIARNEDNFKIDDPKGHEKYEFTLSQSVRWSKNVKDTRNCPDQLLLASFDHRST